MGFDRFTQLFPVVVQRFVDDRIQIFFVGVDRQNAFCIGGFVEPWAGALLFRQFVGRFKQIVLNGFEGFMRQIIGAAVGITLPFFASQ